MRQRRRPKSEKTRRISPFTPNCALPGIYFDCVALVSLVCIELFICRETKSRQLSVFLLCRWGAHIYLIYAPRPCEATKTKRRPPVPQPKKSDNAGAPSGQIGLHRVRAHMSPSVLSKCFIAHFDSHSPIKCGPNVLATSKVKSN